MINENKGYADNSDWTLLPDYMIGAMERYLTMGIQPGSFLLAILQNDFMKACQCADEANLWHLPQYARFLHNYVSPAAYGSPEKVKRWMEKRGAAGGAMR